MSMCCSVSEVMVKCWRTERSGVNITTLRALVGGRVVVFNTRAYFVSFAILGQGLLYACPLKEVMAPMAVIPRFANWSNRRDEAASLCQWRSTREVFRGVRGGAVCPTTCLALVSKVVNDKFGTVEGLMAAMHAITTTQLIVYGPSRSGTRVRSSSPPLRREHSCQGGPGLNG